MPNVKKRNRHESDFEVIHHLYQMRKEVTDLLLFDFGYSHERELRQVSKSFGGRQRDVLKAEEKEKYDKILKRLQAYYDWFIQNEREAITDILRNIGRCIFSANDIIPQYWEELAKRRVYQDEAIGYCDDLKQELQYAIETLPVDVNKYIRFSDMIEKEINLIKKWRTSDNRFKKTVIGPPRATPESDTNFCNVNSNGNANNNGASNSNGVRPDFDDAQKPIEHTHQRKEV